MPVVAAIRRITDLPLDVHLMIDRPVRYVEEFCKAGADIVTIHVEADTLEHNLQALQIIRQAGVRAAISVKPKTPAEAVAPYLELVDLVLVMSRGARLWRPEIHGGHDAKARGDPGNDHRQNPTCELEVDGGVILKPAKLASAWSHVLDAGSAISKRKIKSPLQTPFTTRFKRAAFHRKTEPTSLGRFRFFVSFSAGSPANG